MNIIAILLGMDLGDVRMLDPARLTLSGDPGDPRQTEVMDDGRTQATRFAGARADLERLAAGWRPDESDLRAAVSIDEWALAAEHGLSVTGYVHGHPTIPEGHWAVTSTVIAIDVAEGRWVRTMSRFYALGRPEGEVVN